MSIKKPLLAVDVDLKTVVFPLMMSPKIDGVRCLKREGEALARSFKPIPNNHIRNLVERYVPNHCDGELFVGENVRTTNSAVMSKEGVPRFTLNLFDFSESPQQPFGNRYCRLRNVISGMRMTNPKFIKVIKQTVVHNLDEVLALEKKFLADGYEGAVLRDPAGMYKEGRSTLSRQEMMRLVRVLTAEAEILDVYEKMKNTNKAFKGELGQTKRSSHKAGKVGLSMIGGFTVRDLKTGVVFDIGALKGITTERSSSLWFMRKDLVGDVIKYKYKPYGVKDKPRQPVFLSFRDRRDL